MKRHRIDKVRVLPVALVPFAIAGCHYEPHPRPPRVDVSISQISAGQMGVREHIYNLTLRVQVERADQCFRRESAAAVQVSGRT